VGNHIGAFRSLPLLLTGSFLLPILTLIRWAAAKWRPVHFLVTSRRRWAVICGSFQAVKLVLLALLLYRRWGFPPFDFLGWAGMLVHLIAYVLKVPFQYAATEFALSAIISAASEACLGAGAAVTAWWIYDFFSRKKPERKELYGVCLTSSACVLGVLNNPMFWRHDCYDCFAPHGIPFVYYHEGGFAGGARFVWAGVMGNIAISLAMTTLLAIVWLGVSGKPRFKNNTAAS